MKRRVLVTTAIVMALMIGGAVCAADAASTFALSSTPLDFGDHDIGTISKAAPLKVTISSSAPISLQITISGASSSDFRHTSTCPTTPQPQASCEIVVTFEPRPPNEKASSDKTATDQTVTDKTQKQWIADRSATLEVSDGKNPSVKIALTGRAVENIALSLSRLELENQRGIPAQAQSIVVTNYTQSILAGVDAVVSSSDFLADASSCKNLQPTKTCQIYVGYSTSAQQPSTANGSVAIAATLGSTPAAPSASSSAGSSPTPTLTRVVTLSPACMHWYSACQLSPAIVLLVVVSSLYFLGLVLVRWHMIAKPARGQVLAEIEAVRARTAAVASQIPQSREAKARLAQIYALLDSASFPFKHKLFIDSRRFLNAADAKTVNLTTLPEDAKGHLAKREFPSRWTRIFNAVFWTRGQELAGWSLAHEAEVQLVALLPAELVRARLETAEQELRQISTSVTLALADLVKQELSSGEAILVEQARHLLQLVHPLLEPLATPQAAGLALLAELQARASDSLKKLSGTIQQNADPATDLDDGERRLQSILASVDDSQKLGADIDELLTFTNLSPASRTLLQSLADLLEDLKTASQAASTALDKPLTSPEEQQAGLEAFNDALALFPALGIKASSLSAQLTVPVSSSGQPEPDAWQTLLELCQSQAALTSAMTQATTPSANLALVKEVLDDFLQQSEAVLKIVQCATSGGSGIAGCRAAVLDLARLPSVPADMISQVKAAVARDIAAPLERWRAILTETLGQVYGKADQDYFELDSWHNKLIWLVGCALLFINALGLTLPNAILLLVGAIGGLLSRLQRSMNGTGTANDSTWGSLFLSPLTGAFSAWGGILLVILGLKLNLFGSALSLDWQKPDEPVALAIALLFGFSERLFDGIAGKLENKINEPPSSSAQPAKTTTTAAKPTITSITPRTVPAGKEANLSVLGANFSLAAKVSLTDAGNKTIPPKQFKVNSATSIDVTYTPIGTQPYTSTLTVTNPDDQAATAKLDITQPPPE